MFENNQGKRNHDVRNAALILGGVNVGTVGVTTFLEITSGHESFGDSLKTGLIFAGISDGLLLLPVFAVVGTMLTMPRSKTDRFHARKRNPSRDDFNVRK